MEGEAPLLIINVLAGYRPDDAVFERSVFDSHNEACFMAERAMGPAPHQGRGKPQSEEFKN